MTNAPTIFLDFDGVLHPDDVYRIRGEIVLMRDGLPLFAWSPLLVEALEPHPDVRIVLSTSWVRVVGFDKAHERLPIELQRRVVGATWHSSFDPYWWAGLSRYEEIVHYVQRHALTHWLAIDDDVRIWGEEHIERLVETDSTLGLAQPGKLDELKAKLRSVCGGKHAAS